MNAIITHLGGKSFATILPSPLAANSGHLEQFLAQDLALGFAPIGSN